VDDVNNAPRWLSRCKALKQTSPLPKQVGSMLLYTYREGATSGKMDGVVTEYEPDRTLAMKYKDKMFELAIWFKFSPAAGGTHIDHAVEITTKSFMSGLMAPMIRAARLATGEGHRELKELLHAKT
jgi:hypothetical protein